MILWIYWILWWLKAYLFYCLSQECSLEYKERSQRCPTLLVELLILRQKVSAEVNQELGEFRSKFYKTELLYIVCCQAQSWLLTVL